MYKQRVNQQILREFKRNDGNHDGKIDFQEFTDLMKNDEGFAEMGPDFVKLIFWLIDVDKNELIDKEEFTRYKLIRKQFGTHSPESYYTFIFKLIDSDKNELIDYDEFHNYCKAMEGYDAEKVPELFKKLDKNGDNQITLEEFLEGMITL